MAVKIHCSICEKFIKDVDNSELNRLTGEEICTPCGNRVDGLFSELEKGVTEFKGKLDKKHAEMNQRYDSLKKAHGRFESDANSLFSSMSAELNRRKEDILKGGE